MKHIIDEEAEKEKCAFCEEQATHKFTSTVWNSLSSGGSLSGDVYTIFLCCDHFVDLISKTQTPKILEEVKENCLR